MFFNETSDQEMIAHHAKVASHLHLVLYSDISSVVQIIVYKAVHTLAMPIGTLIWPHN